jgi:hypothetical protein
MKNVDARLISVGSTVEFRTLGSNVDPPRQNVHGGVAVVLDARILCTPDIPEELMGSSLVRVDYDTKEVLKSDAVLALLGSEKTRRYQVALVLVPVGDGVWERVGLFHGTGWDEKPDVEYLWKLDAVTRRVITIV